MQNEITVPNRITHGFIVARPQWNFVYGQDKMQRGIMGQAWTAGKEPNTFPVFTCHKLCTSGSVYFTDAEHWRVDMLASIAAIPRDKPIICFHKIGQGCSRMKEFAPKLHAEMVKLLNEIQYKNIKWINA